MIILETEFASVFREKGVEAPSQLRTLDRTSSVSWLWDGRGMLDKTKCWVAKLTVSLKHFF